MNNEQSFPNRSESYTGGSSHKRSPQVLKQQLTVSATNAEAKSRGYDYLGPHLLCTTFT